jgi:hypothetical protein
MRNLILEVPQNLFGQLYFLHLCTVQLERNARPKFCHEDSGPFDYAYPEDGGSRILRNVGNYLQMTWNHALGKMDLC